MNLADRHRITAGVLAEYGPRPFDWKNATCVHLAHAQLKAFGYPVPAMPGFATQTGALRALRRLGHDSVTALLDSLLVRIAPASAKIGDLVALPGEGGLDAVCIADGVGNLFGWHDGDPSRLSAIVGAQGDMVAAWGL